MSTPAGTQPPKLDGFEDTVKDFWSSRPRRSRRGRKIAGVAAGIGNRYGIDPVIVRVVFIVATVMGGFGVPPYLAGWLFLPDERDEVSPIESLLGKGRSSTPPHVTVCLAIVLFPATAWAVGGMWFRGSGLALLALLLLGAFALHRSRGAQFRPTSAPRETAAAPASFSVQAGDSDSDGVPSDAQPSAGWDPLAADPMAWAMPDTDAATPVAVPGRLPRRRSRTAMLTLGLTLLTAAVASALWAADVSWFSPAHAIGLTLGVLGVGMVVSAFAGGGRGLILLAVPLAAAGLLLSALPVQNLPGGGWGEIDATPRSLADVEPLYQRTGGSIRLDLTAIPESDEPVDTVVKVGMGEAEVVVPRTADVQFICESGAGTVDCFGRQQQGVGNDGIGDRNDGPDGPGGQQIILDVSSVAGNVEVRRVG